MANEKMKHELVKIDFNTNEFKFYNVEVIALGFNDLQVTFHHGKLGNEGRRTVHRTDSYKTAMKKAANMVHELKEEQNYMDLEDMKGWLNQNTTEENLPKNKKKEKKKKTFPCDECGKSIPEKIYRKIDDWGRNSGNWDKDVNLICYKKVLCFDCQVEHDLYQKRL